MLDASGDLSDPEAFWMPLGLAWDVFWRLVVAYHVCLLRARAFESVLEASWGLFGGLVGAS
eukprot:3157452-Pyramimonas_sp.AAC.1